MRKMRKKMMRKILTKKNEFDLLQSVFHKQTVHIQSTHLLTIKLLVDYILGLKATIHRLTFSKTFCFDCHSSRCG